MNEPSTIQTHKAADVAELRHAEVYSDETDCSECGKAMKQGERGILMTVPFEDFYCSRSCALADAQEYLNRLAGL